MPNMRAILHAAVVIVSFPAYVLMSIALLLMVCGSLLAYKIDPDAKAGNCWSFALARWVKFGGALAVVPAGDVWFLRWLPILHCIWVQQMGPSDSQMTMPRKRMTGWLAKWFPWRVIYFRYRVISTKR